MPSSIMFHAPEKWLDITSVDEERFVQGLRDLGIDEVRLKHDLGAYRAAAATYQAPVSIPRGMAFYGIDGPMKYLEYRYEQKRKTAMDGIRRWFKKRRYRVEASVTRRVKLPIFRLHSPMVRGSKVVYRESSAGKWDRTWLVKVFGTGMGAARKCSVEYSTSFESVDGACKLIFVPVTLRVSKIGVYEGTQRISEGLRSDVIGQTGKEVRHNRGIEKCPLATCLEAAVESDQEEVFSLRNESGTSVARYEREWSTETSSEITLGIEAFDVKASVAASVTQTRAIRLAFHLPGGHDYRLRRLRSEHGLSWQIE